MTALPCCGHSQLATECRLRVRNDALKRRPHLRSEIDLLGNCESVIDFDSEIANGASKLGMPEQELNSPDASLLVDLRSLSSPHRELQKYVCRAR